MALLSLLWGAGGWIGSLLLVALCVLALHLLNGFHFVHGLPVFISKRLPAALLEEIRPTVMREWANENRLKIRNQFNETLLDRYDVSVELPATDSPPEGGDTDPSN